MHSPLNNSKGFTLIEAMISILVISIGLLAITRMQISSINGNATAMNTMRATYATTALADNLLGLSYEDPLVANGTDTPSTEGIYALRYQVRDVQLYNGQTIKSIALTTQWTENGQAKIYQNTITKIPD